MDIERELLREHSKSLTLKIAGWIGTDPGRLQVFLDVFFGGDRLIEQRGAWVIGTMSETHPELYLPHLKRLIAVMKRPGVHDAVKRNITGLLQNVEIPRRLQGLAASVCFDLLSSPAEAIAVKVNAMTVLARICRQEPDLEHELRLIVEQQLPTAGGAFHARARMVLHSAAPPEQ